MRRAVAEAAAALAGRVAGRVVGRGSAGYERVRARMLWNGLVPERRPDLVVRVAAADDVAATVRFARERELRVAVRSGGHSWCGAPLREGGVLLDLGGLDAIEVDPAARRVTAEPAATNAALASELAAHGLAFPYGHCPSVALGGYLLAGGFGWNGRMWGLAAHNVEAIDVVLADGRRVTADARHHADLLWAARGAGPGFFAVVTRFHLRARPLPTACAAASSVFRLADAAPVARWIDTLAGTLPDRVELTLFVAPAPLFLPDGAPGEHVLVVAAASFAARRRDAEHALAFLAASPGRRRALAYRPPAATSFDELFASTSALYEEGLRFVADTAWSAAPFAELLPVLGRALERAPVASAFFLCSVAPVTRRARVPGPALPAGRTLIYGYASWADAAVDAAVPAWRDDAMDALAPFTAGHYVGEADLAAVPARAPRSFAPASWRRLERLRRKYDPDGLFHAWFEAT